MYSVIRAAARPIERGTRISAADVHRPKKNVFITEPQALGLETSEVQPIMLLGMPLVPETKYCTPFTLMTEDS